VRLTRQGAATPIAGRPLAYQPTASTLNEPPDTRWTEAERLEYAVGDLTGATRAYRALASSRDPSVRAAALIRVARTLRRSGQPDEALAIYAACNDDWRYGPWGSSRPARALGPHRAPGRTQSA
jgi:hypothetical protein